VECEIESINGLPKWLSPVWGSSAALYDHDLWRFGGGWLDQLLLSRAG